MENCIFCKIANKEIPKEFLYEDEYVMVFPDINPVKKIHLLIIPKKHYADFMEAKDPVFHEKIAMTIQTMVLKEGLQDKGFRILVNGGGAQAIDHLHYHLLGPMGKAAAI